MHAGAQPATQVDDRLSIITSTHTLTLNSIFVHSTTSSLVETHKSTIPRQNQNATCITPDDAWALKNWQMKSTLQINPTYKNACLSPTDKLTSRVPRIRTTNRPPLSCAFSASSVGKSMVNAIAVFCQWHRDGFGARCHCQIECNRIDKPRIHATVCGYRFLNFWYQTRIFFEKWPADRRTHIKRTYTTQPILQLNDLTVESAS